jgi:signal transduction histidine kinase
MKSFAMLADFFNAGPFMPHGHCYFWTTSLIGLHTISDGLIVLAYYSIPFTLIYFARKRTDLKFHWMFVCFAVFILACGTTHLLEIWNIWHGNYWLSGSVKAITALASVPTAILLYRLVPQALALPSPEALRRARDDLEVRVRERTDELEVANKELESFSYSVSHDLRAPLRAINGFADLALADYSSLLPERGRRYLRIIQEDSLRMGELIDDLLDFSRLGREALAPTFVDPGPLVREALAELGPQREGRVVDLRVGELPACLGDARLLKQVWINLVSNALKYSRERSPAVIEIGCDKDVGEMVYFVRDNGAGFDMAYADRLFGVFQRMHTSDEFEGTGVGLAIVQRIVHRHAGRVWAEAKVNEGAVFYFTLNLKETIKA